MISHGLTFLYLIWTLLTSSLVAVALVPLPKYVAPRQRYAVMILGSLISEFPFIFLLAKFAVLMWFKSSGGIFSHEIVTTSVGPVAGAAENNSTEAAANVTTITTTYNPNSLWSEWVFTIDILVFLAYWALTLQLYFAKTVVDNATGVYKVDDSTEAPQMFRIMNPFWRPRHVKVQRDVVYATEEELNFAGPGMEQYLSLDVHHHPAYPRNRPVLMYIHAGSYQSGSKSFPYPPFLHYLTNHRWVVVSINTRLSPQVPYPTHLTDAKRALRWIRANIHAYGGDPSFVAVAGAASGAHLAAMMALSQNDPFYQPGFEDADTSVQACVAVNSILDVTDSRRTFGSGFASWFAKKVCGRDLEREEDAEFIKLSSPLMLLKGLEMDRRKSGASIAAVERMRAESISTQGGVPSAEGDAKKPVGLKSADKLPPFLIFHGAADSIIPVRHVRDFVSTFKKVSKSVITYIEFPSANHMYNIVGCRSHYMAYGIERFLNHMHLQSQAKGLKSD
ncbi:hypothetical protein HK101_004573 [Irineochytrium annulatum]|nr:hypothetical protein HK101_004573 [Irineochytrium annulatum]